jgi:GMP reductase
MLGGHNESGGDIVEENNIKYKMIYGMSSKLAQDKHLGGMKSYRSSEGKVRKIEYRGPVSNTVMDIMGGMRSTGTYIGARRLKDFPKCATFVKVNRILNHSMDKKNNMI